MPHIAGHPAQGPILNQPNVPIQGPLQFPQQAQAQPQFGLQGFEQALGAGLQGATDVRITGAELGRGDIQAGQGQVAQRFNQATEGLQPFVDPGQQANQRRAALSGAFGPEAQAQAFQTFQEDPFQSFLQEEQQRELLNTAAGTGQSLGGNVLEEAQRRAAGRALGSFQQQFQNLSDITGTGLQAAGQVGSLRGNQAGTEAQLFRDLSGIATGTGEQIGTDIRGTGRDIAFGRQQAGRDISDVTGQGVTALSGLIEREGAGVSDIIGQGTTGIQNLITAAGEGNAGAIQQLQALLANLSQGEASQVAGLPTFAAQTGPSALGQVGQIASGVGTALGTFPNNQPPPSAFAAQANAPLLVA